MHKILPVLCVAPALLMAAPALAQGSPERYCELHLWALGYVPNPEAAAKSKAMVRVSPPNYSDPHSSGSLLDARQRLPEIDAPKMLEQLGLSADYKVVIHPKGKLRICPSS